MFVCVLLKDAPPSLEDDSSDLFNGDFSTLKISDSKPEMETVPISNSNSVRTPTMEEVLYVTAYTATYYC